jgi:1-acyl-sn-glycerol-3-phosphate acyltransferase
VEAPGYDAKAARAAAPTVVSNHVSWLDPVLLQYLLGDLTAAANSFYFAIPVVGLIAKAWGIIGIGVQSTSAGSKASTGTAQVRTMHLETLVSFGSILGFGIFWV